MNQEGTKPDPEKVEALRDFPAPGNLTNLKSYLCLANQLSIFCPDLKHSLEPLKPLLLAKNACNWNNPLQRAFEKSKEVLCSDQVLKKYDLKKHTVLITDTTHIGLGFVVIQTKEKLELDHSAQN